jgi:hypothetical protein
MTHRGARDRASAAGYGTSRVARRNAKLKALRKLVGKNRVIVAVDLALSIRMASGGGHHRGGKHRQADHARPAPLPLYLILASVSWRCRDLGPGRCRKPR